MSFWVVDYIQGGFIDAFIGKCDLIKSAIIIVSICQEQISCRSLSSSSVFPIFQVIVLLECSDLGSDLGSDQIRAYVCQHVCPSHTQIKYPMKLFWQEIQNPSCRAYLEFTSSESRQFILSSLLEGHFGTLSSNINSMEKIPHDSTFFLSNVVLTFSRLGVCLSLKRWISNRAQFHMPRY